MRGRVFIIGLGLIGGSLALSIKKLHQDSVLVGYDINDEQARLGKMLGVVDETVSSIKEGAETADLILIAAPVNETGRILASLPKMNLKNNVIISDAGSTKKEIVKMAAGLKESGNVFIGGHPMAGSHKSGVQAAKAILFENAFYLLTPEAHIPEEAIATLQRWLAGTNARFITVTPDEHDHLTGVISHFPHIIAASLVHQAEKSSESQKLIPRLAAGGFRDITRIASSSPEMWRDILIHNNDVLLSLLEDWQVEMERVKSLLQMADKDDIFSYFLGAKQFRDELPQKQKGAIPAFYDLFVDVPDYPGVISEITGYLAKEKISITNISIRETREEINGVLVISFQTEEDRDRAMDCIQNHTNFDQTIGM
ncbi:prephenate dehydrogenase [Cytobacillus purgationiresistens]|uniref:Prephenate dehydrogenase n=1 Tax=Cytobacillus purgationiresistens TaxID=863449 RepID=A0ABU0AIJ5_9BACI|nr:prephenate dehydrogenase [Cytobacillus purgationiresistens]MDQ0271074.1 prephenate dehydrogenase [Cytobacillus purgationiresistens]